MRQLCERNDAEGDKNDVNQSCFRGAFTWKFPDLAKSWAIHFAKDDDEMLI